MRRRSPEARVNRRLYRQILSRMTPSQRVEKAFELSALTRQLFKDGLRRRFPDKSEAELHRIMLERLDRCRKRNS